MYGVRVSRMGARRAPFGTRMTVCSFTPSRIGIMTSRRTWSKPSLVGTSFAGISLGSDGTCAGKLPIDTNTRQRPRHDTSDWRETNAYTFGSW